MDKSRGVPAQLGEAVVRRPGTGKARLTVQTAAHGIMVKWFQAVLDRQAMKIPPSEFIPLADQLKILLNRADNAERDRMNDATAARKDVSPGELLAQKTDALILAAAEYQDFAGDNFPTPDGDVDLNDLRDLLKRVLSVRSAPERRGRRGTPPVPWKDAAAKFQKLVEQVLRKYGVRGPLSASEPSSQTVAITATALRWAYADRITPDGVVAALRRRDRRKPIKSPIADLLQ